MFGAVALGFYGHVRATADLDIVVRPTEDNLGRVGDWLVGLDAHLAGQHSRCFPAREGWQMLKCSNATVLTTLGQVDVVQELLGPTRLDRPHAEGEATSSTT